MAKILKKKNKIDRIEGKSKNMKVQYQNTHITVFESALFRTTTSLIVTDDLVLLVDPNWLPIEIEFIQKAVSKVKGNKPLYLLFTHSDYDHIIGYEAFPTATIIASEAFVNNPNKDTILQQIRDFDDEYYIKRPYLTTYPQVDIVIREDGQELKIGKTILHFYLAPGHNIDGIFTILPQQELWIAGDYLSNIEFPYIYHSSIDYEKTLGQIATFFEKYAIEVMVTGHGDVALTQEEIQTRAKDSLAYIRELRQCVKVGKTFDFDKLMQQYAFPKIMKKFHDANVELMRKEKGENLFPK